MPVSIPPHIESLEPYRAGKGTEELKRERGLKRIVKLASNENPLGPSPKALAAMVGCLNGLHRYPDPGGFELVQALAAHFEIDAARIICGHGSDSLIAYALNAFTSDGDEVLTSEGTFIGIYVSTRKFGRVLKQVPLKDYAYDLDAIAKAVGPKTKIVYLANPNNPTGTMFTRQAFEAFMKKIPAHVLVLLDEAYTAYAEDVPNYPDGLSYNNPNLLVLHTLSKAYGLAGVRVGFAIGPATLVRELYKVKLPFEPNSLAQVAAIAALEDKAFLAQTKEANRASLERFRKAFQKMGLRTVESAANFLMLVFADEKTATAFHEGVLSRGLILRPLKSFGLPNCVRINSGTAEETDFALEVLAAVLAEAPGQGYTPPTKGQGR